MPMAAWVINAEADWHVGKKGRGRPTRRQGGEMIRAMEQKLVNARAKGVARDQRVIAAAVGVGSE